MSARAESAMQNQLRIRPAQITQILLLGKQQIDQIDVDGVHLMVVHHIPHHPTQSLIALLDILAVGKEFDVFPFPGSRPVNGQYPASFPKPAIIRQNDFRQQ